MPATNNILEHACAECKRLKLKCDKKVPCSACIRRGCPTICPDGRLVAGKGSRFILSNTRELHEENTAMKLRIKVLEQALAELQSRLTSDPHPLLVESLRTTGEGLQPDEDTRENNAEEEELIDTFGSLTIDTKGETIWYGSHAGSAYLIPRENSPAKENSTDLPIDILLLSKQFPFKSLHETEEIARKLIRSHLPPQSVASKVISDHHSRPLWNHKSVAWDDFRETIFEPVYSANQTANDQQIGVFFINMAIATLLESENPNGQPEPQRYYHLSRASMSLGEDIFQSRSLYAIQYLQSLATYNSRSNDPNGINRAWGATGLAVRLAQMVGLHRDNEKWDRYPDQAERRRRIWWELLCSETTQSFAMGRPRSIYPTQYDTKMPKDDEDEGKYPSFNRVRQRWNRDCLGRVLDEAFAAKAPSYNTILKLDKYLRDWNMASLPSVTSNEILSKNLGDNHVIMLSQSTNGLREMTLLYLHRRYFVEALERHSREPLRSKYSMSVLAVHRSALFLLHGTLRTADMIKNKIAAINFLSPHALWVLLISWCRSLHGPRTAYVCLCTPFEALLTMV
ncbi:hypothetical protein CPB86DRAFT_725038 [Serendipita vermifera]|nr:hypothetical protein CPB86DRAFT_725038 [Serendipita vermifera]